MEDASGRNKQIISVLAVLIVIVAIVGGAVALNGKDESPQSSTTSSVESTNSVAADPNAVYTDGTYEAVGDYVSPGGSQEISVSVTLKDGVITDTSAQNGSSDVESKEYQEEFIDNYKSQVVGKKLSEVSLDRVAGSSLTPNGFNDAIQKIRQQAEA